MYIHVSPFFSIKKLAKSTTTLCTGVYCAGLGRFKKLVILDISGGLFFFHGPPVGNVFSNGQTAFLL